MEDRQLNQFLMVISKYLSFIQGQGNRYLNQVFHCLCTIDIQVQSNESLKFELKKNLVLAILFYKIISFFQFQYQDHNQY